MKSKIIYSYNSMESVDFVPTNKPSCVFFGGHKSLYPVIAINDIKKFHNFAKNKNLDNNFYGVVYSVPGSNHNLFPNLVKPELRKFIKEKLVIITSFINRYFFHKYVQNIFDATIKPRIQSSKNEKLPLDIACQNLRNIVFIAHCYGVFVADYLIKLTDNKLKSLGYSFDEIAKLKQQIVIITLSPSYLLLNPNYSIINFASASDNTILYNSVFKGITRVTFIPDFNLVITPSMFINNTCSGNLDHEHRMWPLDCNESMSAHGCECQNLLNNALYNAMQSKPVTDKECLLSPSNHQSEYTPSVNVKHTNANRIILFQSIKKFLSKSI